MFARFQFLVARLINRDILSLSRKWTNGTQSINSRATDSCLKKKNKKKVNDR